MKYLRRLAGMVLMLAGAIGIALSSITIYGIHQASTSLSRQSTDILDSTKEGVVFLKHGTRKTQNLLGEAKERTHTLESALVDVAMKVKDNRSEKALLNTLDKNIVKQLARAQSTLAALQSTLDGFRNTLVLFNSLERFSKSKSTKDHKDLDENEGLSRSLTEASENLDQISRFLDEALADREVTLKRLNEVLIWIGQIQGRLADSERQVNEFRQRLNVTEERIASSQKTIPVWIDNGSLFAMLLLGCFAFSQVGLLFQGLSLLGKSEKDAGPANSAAHP